ncbi:precorrin-3B synthase [Ochrobactrum sp. P6BS-III]|uniref:precorrin-3B synthase n=1 Tax=unclassified Ochrobactrum TaxID=239106 RepID=UPI00099378D2|nr:precorrin-3B synthase [Ochrobactrum sp. P6BSIII]OOL16443.1 precorrin-3B synthase [Ochrobactrum sp. P6BS-III]
MLNQKTIATSTGPSDRRNACPGLSRMVMARDGAIARIKLPLGRVNADQVFALAEIAEKFGPNAVELSIRSNFQLRAIAPENWEQAITALYQAGFGADNPAADDIRNIMVSPTSGIDRDQMCNVTPLACQLLTTLENNTDYHALSPKFSFQIDGGEACAIVSHPGDIWLSAADGGRHFAFGFASSPDGTALGRIEADHALPLVEAVLRLFLARSKGAARMKQLFEVIAIEEFLNELTASLPFPIEPATHWQRRQPHALAHLGAHIQADGRFYIGAMPFLGRLDTTQLRALGALSQKISGDEIRLTPWQGVVLPNVDAANCDETIRQLHALGLSTLAQAPQSRLRSCTGSTGCASALSDTQADAKELALLLDGDSAEVVHLTSCTKSCAALAPLPHTLLARAPGRYDVFFADKAGPSRFGQLLATDVTIDTAARLLNSPERKP